MKKALLFAAVTLMSASAFASKARVNALAGSVTVQDDVQDIFTNPTDIFDFGDILTIEFGPQLTSTAGTTSSGLNGYGEGGFFRSNGDSKMGIYFGNRSESFHNAVTTAKSSGLALIYEQNPFEIFYGQKGGDMSWAASFKYSNGKDYVNATTSAKTNTMGFRVGATTDVWEAYLSMGLGGEAAVGNAAGDKLKNDMALKLGGEYIVGDVTYYGLYDSSSGKVTVASTDTKAATSNITLGAETKVKSDVAHFFYGARYVMASTKVDPPAGAGSKTDISKLPIYAGVEGDAASWLTLRASLSQSFFINSTKSESGGATTTDDSGLNDTAVAFGAGIKMGKMLIDGTMQAGTNGTIDGNNLLTTASLTYNF